MPLSSALAAAIRQPIAALRRPKVRAHDRPQPHPLPRRSPAAHDADPAETAEWRDAFAGAGRQRRARRARASMLDELARAGAQPAVGWPPELVTPYVNTIPVDAAAGVPGRPGDRGAAGLADALERAGDGGARQPGVRRARRPHRQLCQRGRPVRGRLQPLLPRAQRRSTAATWCSSSRTARRASMRAPSSKAG